MNIDIKKIIFFLLIVLVLGIGIFFGFNLIMDNNKKYDKENVSEDDAKYFYVCSGEKYGVMNDNGDVIVDIKYDNIFIPNPIKPVFICKNTDGGYETLNDQNERIFQEFDNVQAIELRENTGTLPYEKSVLKYEKDGKYGLIDFKGKVISKPIYEEIASLKYKEGEILAKKNGKYGVINNKGYILIPFEYDEIEGDKYYKDDYNKSGYIVKNRIQDGYRYGFIDCNWKKILNTEYTSISRVLDIDDDNIYLVASKNGQYGFIKNREVQVEFSYQGMIYNSSTGLLSVQKNENYGVIDLNGNNIIPVQYKGIRFNGVCICAKGYGADEYFNAKGEKINNRFYRNERD